MSSSKVTSLPEREVRLRWNQVSQSPLCALAIRGGSATLVGSQVYIVGGIAKLAVLSCHNWKLRLLSETIWGPGQWHVAQLVDEKIYILGGSAREGLVEYDTVF